MALYLSKVQANLDKLSKWVIKRIPDIENVQVDSLVGIVATLPIKEAVLLPIYLQATSQIIATLVCNTNEAGVTWMNEIKAYIQIGELPKESKQAHKIWVQTARSL